MTGSSKQTTQTTNNAPWSGAQPALNTALSGAQNLYNSGVGAGVYTGSTVVPYDQETRNAMGGIAGNAYANVDGRGVSGKYRDIISNGGYTGAQQDALAGYRGIAANGGLNAAQQNALGGFQGLTANGGLNAAQQNALSNSKSLANASWSVSPELQKIISQTNADANTNVGLANSAAGRYGSGLGNSAIADAVSKNTNNLLYTDLNNFQTRKDAANASLFNMGQTGQSNLSNAYGNISNLGQTGQSNVSNALGDISNIGQNGVGNLSSAWQGLQTTMNPLAQSGQFYDNLATNELNDRLRIFDAQQNRPWENLSRLNAIASGAGQLGGTQTQSQPGQSPWLTAAGYGLTGAGLLGSFF